MSDIDTLKYCEDCKQVTPHIVSGSGKKFICQGAKMPVAKNLNHLVEAWDKKIWKTKIVFGKHKGRQLSDIPKDYVDWARTQTQSVSVPRLFIEPRQLHNMYIRATELATQVNIDPFYNRLSKEEKAIWEEMAVLLNRTIITMKYRKGKK